MANATDANPDLLLDLARDRLATQLSFADALDQKILSLFGISAALIGILAAVLTFRQGALHDVLVGVLAGLSCLCFVGMGLSAFGSGRGTEWTFGPDLAPGKIARFLGDPVQSKAIAAHSLIQYYNDNQTAYGSKKCRLLASTRLLTAQTVLLLILAGRTGGLF